MNLKDTADKVADFLWDLVTNDPGDNVQQFTADPGQFLADHGHQGLTADDLDAAFGRLADRLPADQFVQMSPVRTAAQSIGCAPGGGSALHAGPSMVSAPLGSNASMVARAAAPPQPQVVRHVTEHRVTQVREAPREAAQQVTPQQVTQQHVTQQHVTNHYVREGDTNTTVDNRTITEIHARGDVDFDQRIDTRTVVATKGGVAVDGDVEDSAINTGKNTGIIAGDDVELEDSIVGNGNTQLNDSEVGAFSGRGNATNVTGENVNTGSGDLTAVRAGGDAQVADGNGNRFSGDTDVEFDRVDGPINLAVGDENRQQAEEDNSTEVEESFNTDASTQASQNRTVEDSANQLSTDNDARTTQAERSFNQSAEDNDTTNLATDGSGLPLATGPEGPGLDGSDPLATHPTAGDQPAANEMGNEVGGEQLGGHGLGELGGEDLFPSVVGTPLDEFEPDPDLDDI